MSTDTLTVTFDVRCASCRRRVAVTDKSTALRNKVYCSKWCLDEPAATEFEERNDIWRLMAANGVKPVRIARLFGADHALVYRVIGKTSIVQVPHQRPL